MAGARSSALKIGWDQRGEHRLLLGAAVAEAVVEEVHGGALPRHDEHLRDRGLREADATYSSPSPSGQAGASGGLPKGMLRMVLA